MTQEGMPCAIGEEDTDNIPGIIDAGSKRLRTPERPQIGRNTLVPDVRMGFVVGGIHRASTCPRLLRASKCTESNPGAGRTSLRA